MSKSQHGVFDTLKILSSTSNFDFKSLEGETQSLQSQFIGDIL